MTAGGGTLGPADVAAIRMLLGLTLDQMAAALGVNPRTPRAWESGRYATSQSSSDAIWALKARHDQLVDEMIDADGVVWLPRDAAGRGGLPRGWWVAAAGRALDAEPGLDVDWDGVASPKH